MIPRLLWGAVTNAVYCGCISLLLILPFSSWTNAFFHSQGNVIEPLNNAGLFINQLLENNANVTSLLDQNIDHIYRPVNVDYPSLEERSDDYLGRDFVSVRARFNYITAVVVTLFCSGNLQRKLCVVIHCSRGIKWTARVKGLKVKRRIPKRLIYFDRLSN